MRATKHVFFENIIKHNITIVNIIVKYYICFIENNIIIIVNVTRTRTNTIIFETRQIIQNLLKITRQVKLNITTKNLKKLNHNRATSIIFVDNIIIDIENKTKSDFTTIFVEKNLLRENVVNQNVTN